MNAIEAPISMCRICSSPKLNKVIDFGKLALTGIFEIDGSIVPKASLVLMRCEECGLVQLGHTYQQEVLYGSTYGYESHLNQSMVVHLHQKARILERKYLGHISNPVIVDIASNDGTLLSGYESADSTKVGIDPLIEVVEDYYPKDSIKIKEFFSADAFENILDRKANLVTSLSVIYDLEDPVRFARDVCKILDDEGIWHFEQSYLPLMIETNSFDTICHEHLLYLSLSDIKRIIELAGMHLVDASINTVNGGSIAITAIKSRNKPAVSPFVDYLLNREIEVGISDGSQLNLFAQLFHKHCSDLKSLIMAHKELDFDVVAIGASTKGNVLLQVSGLDSSQIRVVGEVNPRKFGKQTPGTGIPIIPESELLKLANEKTLILILPWHFRENLLPKFEQFLSSGGKILFPLPRIELIAN